MTAWITHTTKASADKPQRNFLARFQFAKNFEEAYILANSIAKLLVSEKYSDAYVSISDDMVTIQLHSISEEPVSPYEYELAMKISKIIDKE